MKQTIIGVFNSQNQAELALKEISFDRLANSEISILKLKDDNQTGDEVVPTSSPTAKPFANLRGFSLQGANFEIADLGEAYIAGPLVSRLKNDTAQNLTATLITYGVTEDGALKYLTPAKNGKTILIVETNSTKSSNVANVMSEYGGKDIWKWNKNLDHGSKVTKSP